LLKPLSKSLRAFLGDSPKTLQTFLSVSKVFIPKKPGRARLIDHIFKSD